MGCKREIKETVKKDFNSVKQFFLPQSKWRPWHVPCLPYPRYQGRRNVGRAGGGGQKKVEGNGNLRKTKKTLPIIKPVTRRSSPEKNVCHSLKECVGHSLKNLVPFLQTPRLPLCPIHVRACQLCLLQFNSIVDFKNNKTYYRQQFQFDLDIS